MFDFDTVIFFLGAGLWLIGAILIGYDIRTVERLKKALKQARLRIAELEGPHAG